MKKFSEAVLAKHKHMALKANPHHAHSQGLVYTPKGKEEVRPIDTADAGYGGESVSDAEGGEADAGKASKKAVSPMKMPTLVKPGLDKANEETERERLQKLRSFAWKSSRAGLGSDYHQALGGSEVYRKDMGGVKRAVMEDEQIDELKKSTLASYAKKATDDVSYHSFTAGTMSSKDPERLAQDKKAMKRQTGVIKAIDRLAKEEAELDERNMENKAKKDNVVRQVGTHAYIKHGADAGSSYFSSKMTGRKVMSDPKFKSSKIADMYRKLPSMKEENDGTEADAGEYGYEGDMAMTQLKSIIRNAKELHDHMEPQTDLPEWVQSKITLAADYIQTAADYWKSEKEEAMSEGKAEDEKAARAADVLGGPVKPKSSVIGGPGQPKSARNLAMRLATKAMKAGRSVSEEKKSKVPRIGEMEKALEEEVWDKPMPDSKKQGSLSAEQKAKAKARADRAGRSYPNMIDNMWASKQ